MLAKKHKFLAMEGNDDDDEEWDEEYDEDEE